MAVLRVCYRQDVRFDEAYYVSKHLPLAGSIMASYGVTCVEVVKLTTTADGSKPLYQVMFTAYFESETGLQNALQDPRMAEVLSDIQHFYDAMPDILIGEVVPLPV